MKAERETFPNPKTKNWAVIIFLLVAPSLQFCRLDYSPLSDLQDADADSDVSNTDCDINNASKRKVKLHGWQYFMHE